MEHQQLLLHSPDSGFPFGKKKEKKKSSQVSSISNFLPLCNLRIIFHCPTGCPWGLRETPHPARSNDSPLVGTRSLGRSAKHGDARPRVLAMEQHQHGSLRSQGVLPSVLVLLSQSCHLCPSEMQCHGTNPSLQLSAQSTLGFH